MTCNVVRWLLGIPALLLLWGLAVQGERRSIVTDLETRTQQALYNEDLVWAKSKFDITEGRVSGAAYSEEERLKALTIVRRTWGVWTVQDDTALVQEAPNYVWGAEIEGDYLQLTGYVPDERTRRHILQVARESFPDRAVRDRMEPARGAPGQSVWKDAISFGLRQLMQLKRGGRVDLQGTELGVSGEAESVTAYRTIKGDFSRRLPNGIRLTKDEVLPPSVSPYEWQATYRANQVEISGHVPSRERRDQIMEVAKSAFPKAAIVDKMTEAGGAPVGWPAAVSTALRQLALLEHGEAKIVDSKLSFSGIAVKEITSDRIANALRVDTPKSFGIDREVKFLEPTLPTISPFTTSIVSDGKALSLSGFAPDERSRERLTALARKMFPKHEVVDALSYANGAPAEWLTCAGAGMTGLARLDTGRAELSDKLLRLRGVTRSEKVGAALPAEVRAAANRACKDVVEITVKAPPEPTITWQAVSDDKRVELSGEVINSDVKDELVKAAGHLFPKLEIIDNMRIRPGNSEKWPKVVQLGLEQLAKLRSGLIRLESQLLTLDGVAPDTAVANQVKSRIGRGLAAGYRGQAVIQVKSDAMIWSEKEAKRKSEAAAAEEARKKAEAEARARALAEVQRRAAEAAAKARAEAEARRAEEEARLKAEAEAEARRKAEEEARRKAEAEARRLAEEEARRKAEAEARRLAEEEARRKAEAEARRLAEEEARRKAEAEARRLAEEEARRKAEAEARRGAEEEARRKAEAEARRRAEEEARRKAEAEARRRAEEEARRKAEVEARRLAEEEARRKAEAEARRLAEEEARRKAEAEARRKAAEEAGRRRAQEERLRIEAAQAAREERLRAARCKAEFNKTVESGVITFEFGSDRLTSASAKTLDRLVAIYRLCPGAKIEIAGHTDSVGDETRNLDLSQRRAEAVLDYFAQQGLPADKFTARGYGEARPKVPNTTSENRAVNRRIEFDVVAK